MKIKKYSISIAMVFLVSTHIAIASHKGALRPTPQKSSSKLPATNSPADGNPDINAYDFVTPKVNQTQPSGARMPAGTIAQTGKISFGTQAGKSEINNKRNIQNDWLIVNGTPDNVNLRFATSTEQTNSQPNARKSRNPYAQSTNLEAKPVPSQEMIQAISLARKPQKPYKTNKKAPTKEDVKQVNHLGPDQYGFMEFSDTPEYRTYVASDSNLVRNHLLLPSDNQNIRLREAVTKGTIKDNGNYVSFSHPDGKTHFTVQKPAVYKPKSLKINQIIDESNTPGEMNLEFFRLIKETNDQEILNDIKNLNNSSNMQGTFKGKPFNNNLFISNRVTDKLNFIQHQDNIKSILKLSNLKISDSDRISDLLNAFNEDESNRSPYEPRRNNDNQDSPIIKMYTAAIEKATNPLIKSVLDDPQLSLNGKINTLESLKKNNVEINYNDLRSKRVLKVSSGAKLTKLYDEAINKLQTEGVVIENLSKDIATLKESSNKALSSFMSTGSGADLHEFMSNSMMALWKRGAVTSKTIGQTLNNLFTISKTEVSQDLIDNMTADLAADVPTQKSNIEQQAHWFTRASNMISKTISDTIDTMYGAKRPTQKEQNILKNIYDEDYETSARKIVFSLDNQEDFSNIINKIREKTDPNLEPILKELSLQERFQLQREWTTNGQFYPAKFKKWTIEQMRTINPQYDLLGNPLSSTY